MPKPAKPLPKGFLVSAEAAAGPRGPLTRVKVVEFAQVIAGPLAGTLMADLGADVVHVEPPGRGDSARYMGPAKDGAHLWWKVLGRNKRSVTLDMRIDDGRAPAQRLVGWADVVIVTFRADTVEKYGLDWVSVQKVNPSAILLQISGYGARTRKRNFPGFGKMGEACSGLVHLTGFEDGPPGHTPRGRGGLMGAFAVTAALHRRERDPERKGEWVGLAPVGHAVPAGRVADHPPGPARLRAHAIGEPVGRRTRRRGQRLPLRGRGVGDGHVGHSSFGLEHRTAAELRHGQVRDTCGPRRRHPATR